MARGSHRTRRLRDTRGNPGSAHRLGRESRHALDDALARIGRALNAPPGATVVVTANGTEADNLVLQSRVPPSPWAVPCTRDTAGIT